MLTFTLGKVSKKIFHTFQNPPTACPTRQVCKKHGLKIILKLFRTLSEKKIFLPFVEAKILILKGGALDYNHFSGQNNMGAPGPKISENLFNY